MAVPDAQVILASSSPRRRELLTQIGVQFEVLAVDVDESPIANERPEKYVQRIAALKSQRGMELADSELPVLGADTVVTIDGALLGKPRGRDQAIESLNRLSGREHQVFSAVSIRGAQHLQTLSKTTVCFRLLSDREIMAYWNTCEPADKAGAYGIQGLAGMFVKRIEGSFSGVVGLPLYETSELLKEAGVDLSPL